MMNGISSGSLQPTWIGHVATAKDALVLFEACLNGTLHHVPRRPHDRERSSLIKSGYVFIYEENASGIKRWTDGVPWSPSRILGNFLVYRELVKPFPPGEKKRAQKRPKNPRTSKSNEPYPRKSDGEEQPSSMSTARSDSAFESQESKRSLIGSLVDSYGFKEGGLVKKTMSVNLHGVHHHLVSYYKIEDVLEGKLLPPSKDPSLAEIEPRHELLARQNFRAPLDDSDMSMQDSVVGLLSTYEYGRGGYRPGTMISPLNQHSQPSPMTMGGYNSTPFTTSSSMQPGLQSYATVGQPTQPYFSPTSSIPPTMMPKQEPFPQFGTNFTNTHNGKLSIPHDTPSQHSPHTFHYGRQEPVPNIGSRVDGLGSAASMSDSKPLDSNEWARNGPYPSMTSHLSAPSPYATSSSPWNMATSMSHNVPRSDNDWSAMSATHQWNMNTGQDTSRHTNFHMPSQSG